MNTVRKNITLDQEEYNIIQEYAQKSGMSFSSFLSKSALKLIEQEEHMDLLEFLQENCSFLSREEQSEIEQLHLDFSNIEGKELSLDELLQG